MTQFNHEPDDGREMLSFAKIGGAFAVKIGALPQTFKTIRAKSAWYGAFANTSTVYGLTVLDALFVRQFDVQFS